MPADDIPRKMRCNDCDWRGSETEMLTAPNPFDPTVHVTGCPRCKDIGTLLYACDELDCWKDASCGFPTTTGYRHTCGKHYINRDRALDHAG